MLASSSSALCLVLAFLSVMLRRKLKQKLHTPATLSLLCSTRSNARPARRWTKLSLLLWTTYVYVYPTWFVSGSCADPVTSRFVKGTFILRDAIRQMIPDSESPNVSVCTMADLILSRLVSILCQQPSKEQDDEAAQFDESLLHLSSVLDSVLSMESTVREQIPAIALLFCSLDEPL